MVLRPFLYEATACASYLFGCLTHRSLAVVDPHAELVESYLEEAERLGAPIAAVFETHVQADHVSGLPALAELGARAHLPVDSGVGFEHVALVDGAVVELGNTVVRALATPGHAPAHNAYVVSDRRRGTDDPWLVFTGDSLLVGDVGRPDLHAGGQAEAAACELHGSVARLLAGAAALQSLTVALAAERGVNPDLIRREEEPYRRAGQVGEGGGDW
jgi:hydroxyacylglutathione hydrolase